MKNDILLQSRKTAAPILHRAIMKCQPRAQRGNWICPNTTASEGLALLAAGARPSSIYDFQWFTAKAKAGDGRASDFCFDANKGLKALLDKAHNSPHSKRTRK
jgi:hypothetical protein